MLTEREAAEALGLSKTGVHRRRLRGMPLESEEAARAWIAGHPRAVKLSVATSRQRRNPKQPRAVRGDEEDDLGKADSPDEAAYARARADRERSRATRERMDLLEAQGKSIGIDEAVRAAGTAFRVLRDGIDNVPDRICDALAAESDPFVCRHIMRDELRKVLAGFRVQDAVRELPDEDLDEDDV